MQEYARISHPYMPPLSLRVDRELTFSRLTLEEFSSLELLEPFGAGNEPPLLLLREAKLTGIYPISQGKHLRLRLSKEGEEAYAVWFGMSPERFGSAVGETVDLVCSAEPDEYNGETRLSIKIRDLRPSGVDWEHYWPDLQTYEKLLRHEPLTQQEYQRVLPDRRDVATVYRYFRSKGRLPADFDPVSYTHLDVYKRQLLSSLDHPALFGGAAGVWEQFLSGRLGEYEKVLSLKNNLR